MISNKTLTEGDLDPSINDNIEERNNQVTADVSKNKEKDFFHRSLEAFSDCV